ncbi:helix-turn-helix transcriptional regulator [Variovorax sp. LT2P21]|uniref:helix-turn-helix transcriptional regulator n=1 Tax=Variovorax sp. LT2P21 TaxID=3443731 RepID=UPI003F4718C3
MPTPSSLLQAELAAAVACDDALLRTATVCALAGLRMTHLRTLAKRGELRPVKLSPRVLRYRSGDVLAWLRSRAQAIT